MKRAKGVLMSAAGRIKSFFSGLDWRKTADTVKNFFAVKRNAYIAGAAVLVLLLGFGVFAATRDSGVASIDAGAYGEIPPVDNSILRIVQSSPGGTLEGVDRRKEALVVFNHPIVPLAMLDAETKGIFEITPKIRGSFRWYGSRICSFRPESGWEFGQTYTIKIAKGTAALNGMTLPEAYEYSFTMTIPDIETSVRTVSYQGKTIDYDQSFVLRSNYPVKLADVKKSLTIKNGMRTVEYALSYYDSGSGYDDYGYEYGYDGESSSGGSAPGHDRVLITPKTKFERDSAVTIDIADSLYAENRNAKVLSNRSYDFNTHGPLTVSFNDEAKFFQELYSSEIEFSNEVSLLAVKNGVSIKPYAPWIESTRGNDKRIGMNSWKLKAGVQYTITVGRITDIHGNRLNESQTFEMTVPDFRPQFYLEEGGNTVLESKMSPSFPVRISSVPELNVDIAKISLDEIQDDVENERYDSKLSDKINFNSSSLWKTGFGRNQGGRLGFDLKKYLSAGSTGWLGVRLSGDVIGYKGEKERRSETQIVQVTDLGLSVKEGYDASCIWVNSLNTSEPVPGTKVSFYDGDSLIGSATTDAFGYCRIPNKKKDVLRNANYVAERGKNDKAFVTARDYSLPMYYINNNYSRESYKREFIGEIVFDRKLYRPGDTASFKAVLAFRKNGVVSPLKNKSVEVSIDDSNGKELKSFTARTTGEGGVWGSCDIEGGASLGHYQVRISDDTSADDSNDYINDTFQVEEFRPVSFAVDVTGLKDSSVGEHLPLSISGAYLFGAPMSGAEVSYSVTRMKRRAHFDNYDMFVFGDGNLWEDDGIDWSNAGYFTGASGRLDAGGKFSVDLVPGAMLKQEVINEPQKVISISDIYDMKLEARVKDVDDKKVANAAYARVFPGRALVGIRTKNRYQGINQNFDFDLIALDNSGSPGAEGTPVTVYIIKYDYASILSRGPGGTLQPRNSLVKKIIEQQDMILGSTPRTLSVKVPSSGSYTIMAVEKNGMSYSRDSFYAWGGDSPYWFTDDDDSITIIPDKKEYKPGETAKVLIQSPFQKCKAIVTLERESVIWQKTIDINGSGAPVEIEMKEEYLPNVFISAMLIKPRETLSGPVDADTMKSFIDNDLGAPKFKAGFAKLSVTNESKKLPLSIMPDREEYSPGDQVTVTMTTAPNAEIVLSAADRAVLDMIDYRYANPVNKFYQNWQSSVRILENRRFLIKQYRNTQKGESPGGQGKGDELSGRGGFDQDNEDGTRRDIRYTAYWNPKIVADAQGKAVISFKLPHNLSAFRLMALAAKNASYGNAEKEIKVRKAIVIQKNVPRFLRLGDTLAVGAVVINQTQLSDEFTFTLSSDLLSGRQTSTTVTIGAGESKEVTFPVTINLSKYAELKKKILSTSEVGAPQIEVKGKLSVSPVTPDKFISAGIKKEDIVDRLEFTFPVREQSPAEAFTIAGFTSGEEKEFIQLPDQSKILPYLGSFDVRFSSTALIGLERGFSFYKSNPYLCLEQRASAYLLSLTSGTLLKTFSFSPPSGQGYDFSRIRDLFIGDISDFQNSDGGFHLWNDSTEDASNPYLTAYVVYVLQTAKNLGEDIPSSVMNDAVKYLKKFIRNPKKDSYTYLYETFALINYVFALRGEYNSQLEDMLLDNEKSLSIRAHCYLAMAIGADAKIADYRKNRKTKRLFEYVTNHMSVTTQKVSFAESGGGYSRAFYSSGSTSAEALRMMIALDRNNPLIPSIVQYIMADTIVWGDSHGAGSLALALFDYYRVYEKKQSLMSTWGATVFLDSKKLYEATLDRSKLDQQRFSMPLAKLYAFGKAGVQYPLAFASSGNNRMYYTASINYYPVMQTDLARDEGIEVSRSVLDLDNVDGKSVRELKRGSVYLVKLRVVVAKPSFNFVIDDPIPSSFEIVNSAFKTEEEIRKVTVTPVDAQYDYWWCYSAPKVEYRDDRVVITQDYLSPGMHEFTYLVRPLLKGNAYAPAAEAKLMYEPEIFGRSASFSVMVK